MPHNAMDPTTQYLASEYSATLRRYRALHRTIVASPFVLMLAVGLVGHIHGKPHFQPEGTRDYDRRVLAYRNRLISAEAMLSMDRPSRFDVEHEAHQWVLGFASGDLTSLKPAYYEDHLRDGARGEVLRAGLGLSTELALRAEGAIREGRLVGGARDGLLAAETSHGLRDFEISAFLQCLLTARRGLNVLTSTWPSLALAERNALRPRLRLLLVNPEEIEALRRLESDQRDEYQTRQGSASLSTQGVELSLQKNIKRSEASAMARSVRVNNARLRALIDDAPSPASLR